MTRDRMHADELELDAGLVGRLVASQFPEWAGIPLERVPSAGTDNALFRLGDELVVRLPRIHWAVGAVEKEQEWLPRLAPALPLEVPVPLAKGAPGEGYPWPWSVYPWLGGEPEDADRLPAPLQTAVDLAAFVTALRTVDVTGGPAPGEHNSSRGVPLAARDAATRAAIAALVDAIDAATATAAWETALAASDWSAPPVWIHGDLQSGNLLLRDGRLCGVIDFGCLGVGDPACDAMAGWTVFRGEARAAFRAALAVDDATWARGRGWALSFGLIALPYYERSNPVLAGIARRTIEEALADAS